MTMQVNTLSQIIHGTKILPEYCQPAAYTGELFGVEYLYAQSGFRFPTEEDINNQIDEGFCEEGEEDNTIHASQSHSEEFTTVTLPSDSENDHQEVINYISILRRLPGLAEAILLWYD